MNRSAKFWNRMANFYARQPIKDETTYEEKLRITREFFQPHMQVLELGCGTGSTALKHAPFVKHLHATDVSSKMIEIAREAAAKQNISNVSFDVASAKDSVSDPRSLDAILALNLLHLVDHRDALLAKVFRALKTNGVFVTSTPCLSDIAKLFKLVAPIGQFFGMLPSIHFFTLEEFRKSLTGAGFVIEHEWLPDKNKAAFIVARKPA